MASENNMKVDIEKLMHNIEMLKRELGKFLFSFFFHYYYWVMPYFGNFRILVQGYLDGGEPAPVGMSE